MATYESQNVDTYLRAPSVVDDTLIRKQTCLPVTAKIVSWPARAAVVTNSIPAQMRTTTIADQALIDICASLIVCVQCIATITGAAIGTKRIGAIVTAISVPL